MTKKRLSRCLSAENQILRPPPPIAPSSASTNQQADKETSDPGKDKSGTESPSPTDTPEVQEPPLSNSADSSDASPKKQPSKRAKLIIAAVVAIFAIAIIGSMLPCNHEWIEATCTEPKTCSKCEETEGEPLGHDWLDATCTEPRTCSRCGETDGVALGHEVAEWTIVSEATCSQPGSQSGTCTRCGETQTETIPTIAHTEGEWTVTEPPSVLSSGVVVPGTRTLTCSVCGAVIRTEEIDLEVTVSQQNALESALSYLDFTAFSYSGLIEQLEYEGYSTEDATFAADYCGADWNEQAALSAQSYLDFTSFSRAGLIDQLMYEGFTREQAEYGADAVGL